MLKKYIAYLFIITIIGESCQKADDTPYVIKTTSSVALINANGSTKTVDFIIDGNKKNVNAAVGVNGLITGQYVGVSGDSTHILSVKDPANPNTEYYYGTFNTVANNSYSIYIYDTLTAGKFKVLYIPADRTITADNVTTSNTRFLNFSPKSPALDCWLVRIVGTVRTDSVKIGQPLGYIGSTTPSVSTLAMYTSIRANQAAGANGAGSLITSYNIKLTLAATNTIVASANTTLIPARNYTIFARGIYPSTGISLVADN
jgi:hypothetical protein